MATGRVAAEALNDGESTLLYTVPLSPSGSANKNISVCSVSVCNRGNTAEGISIALVPQGETLNNSHWIEHATPLLGHGVIERTGMTLQEGDSIYARAAGANLSAVVFAVFTGQEAPPINLLDNGDFEDGNLTYWNVSGLDSAGVSNGVGVFTASSPGTLDRTDTGILTIGETYLLSIDVANIIQEGGEVFNVTATDTTGGTYVVELDLTQDFTVPITQEFTATTANLELVFTIEATTVNLNGVGVYLQD